MAIAASRGTLASVSGPDRQVAARLRAAFGALYETLMMEAPERAAWSDLPFAEIEAAMRRARDRVAEPGHSLGFRTLLKQELDEVCDLAPAAMPFEASSLPEDRRGHLLRVQRDERTRERERRYEARRQELWRQAAALLSDERD